MDKDKQIIDLRPNNAVELLEQLLELAKKGDIDKFIFAGTNKKNDIVSGALNTTPYEEQTLISYMQFNTYQKFLNCRKDTLIDR